MIFYCGGQYWDTDKYVYVAGYKIIKSWFSGDSDDLPSIEKYGLICKRAYISKVYFDFNNGESFVKDFDICVISKSEMARELGFTHLLSVDSSVTAIKKKLGLNGGIKWKK